MQAGDYLAGLADLPFGGMEDLVEREPFLVLSPHPDDETLGCGGLLAAAEAAGVRGHVLILTDGSASHPNSPSFPAKRLIALRRDEARCAMAALGLPDGRLDFLDLKDAATPGDGPAFETAVAAIARHAEVVRARTLLVTWGHDPHCDHETAYAMATAVSRRLGLRLWAYPVWGLHLPPDQTIDAVPPRGLRFDIGAHSVAKHRAIACYASQMTAMIDDDPSGFCFTEKQLKPFLGQTETFISVTV